MIRSRVGCAFPASADFVGRAVLIGAQIRAAAHDALGNAGLAGIIAVTGPLWISRRLFGGCQFGVIIGAVPIGAPLPDIAGHVVEAKTIGRKGANGSIGAIAVF